jgi:CRISPR system Cascade subunit CasA
MHYDVLTEPWIPVVDNQGKRRELGLLALLAQAHELKVVSDPAPPIQLGLYRFLVTFVQTALQIQEFEDLEDVLSEEKFDVEPFERYVEQVGISRFDLFDAEHPFLQSPPFPDDDKRRKSVVELFYHLPAGTNVTHFLHMTEDDHAVSPAVAARALCSISPFMTAGGAGYSPSINGTPPWYVMALGENLFETILYNCCVMEMPGLEHPTPPVWASESPLVPRAERTCTSLAEGYTWQPRRVRLLPSNGGICTYLGRESPVLIRDMVWGPGHKFVGHDTWKDPQVAYERNQKRDMWLALRPREGKQLWRDYGPLFLLREKDPSNRVFSRPEIVNQISTLKAEGIVSADKAEQFEVYGMRTDKAKIFEWYYERLPLSTGVLSSPTSGVQVQLAVDLAEQVAGRLTSAVRCLYPSRAPGSQTKEQASANVKALNRLVERALLEYWKSMEVFFMGPYLQALSRQAPDDEDAREKLLDSWKEELRKVGWGCLDEAVKAVETNAASLERQVRARNVFAAGLAKVLGERKSKQERRENLHDSRDDSITIDATVRRTITGA